MLCKVQSKVTVGSHKYICTFLAKMAVILLPLRLVSLTHKNPKEHKIIHGMRPVGHKDQGDVFKEYPVCVLSVAALVAVV